LYVFGNKSDAPSSTVIILVQDVGRYESKRVFAVLGLFSGWAVIKAQAEWFDA
jgi:hypothetical protein